jgi:ubiquinol-cytochrome c reductase cytochrome c1 subunit
MRELKILIVVIFFTLVTYWGVEPFAHSVMHKHVESEGFTYESLAKDKDLKRFVEAVGKGDVAKGEESVMTNCVACHSLKAKSMPAPMDAVTSSASYGVNPPDLSNMGSILDEKYLAAFIADPAKTSIVAHKFTGGKTHPMPGYNWMSPEEIANIVAYLKSIAKPVDKLTPKEVFVDACGRCHAVRYDHKVLGQKWTQIGQKHRFKYEKDSLAFDIKLLEYQNNLKNYMGKLPPDLSIMIRARSHNFLESFIENPQTQLPGTAMPSVGLNKAGYEKIIDYLKEVGDPTYKDRADIGPSFMIYLVIFAIFAFLWKQNVWKKLH